MPSLPERLFQRSIRAAGGLRLASVFLSYDRDDADKARPIASALEKAGRSVWWDKHIGGGTQYAKEIEQALNSADVIVALWSASSVDSPWVRDEAGAGRDRGRLVPLSLDETAPPLGFRQFQSIDLGSWQGRGRVPRLKEILTAIERQTKQPGIAATAPAAPVSRRRYGPSLNTWALIAVGIGMFFVIVGLLIGRPWEQESSSVPIVAVEPADNSTDASALARDLLFKLGSLRAAKTDAVRLTEPGAGNARADLIFEAGGNNVALLSGKDRSVLWSKEFDAPNRTSLEQSMAYTAGQVLDCALQTSARSQERLDEQTLKLFLNGCALFAERYLSDSAAVVPIFSQVVAAAPRFQPAWSKLLLTEAWYTLGQMLFYDRWAPGSLPEHIRAVRRLNPKLPELYVAEAALLPLSALDQRLSLLNEAVRLNPDNPNVLVARAVTLTWFGRMHDATEDARRAAELDALSPGLQSNFIQALTYEGQLQAAENELHRAEQLWPASPAIADARFGLHSRYGDAKDALRLLQSPDFHQPYSTEGMEPYLLARLNPTPANIEKAIAALRGAQLAPSRKLHQLAQLLAEFGRNDELYKQLADLRPDQLRTLAVVFFRPPFQQFRRDPRFMPLAARAGLASIWRKTGKWPDFCFEPGLPYDCKKEAARLNA